MWDNMQIGIDIATAFSVIGAAIAFIWESISTRKQESKQRIKELITTNMMKTANRVVDGQKDLHIALFDINEAMIQGERTQDLTPFKRVILDLIFVFRTSLFSFDQVYMEGNLIKIAEKYKTEMENYGMVVVRATTQGSGEEFDFNEFHRITERHITEFMKITESYIAAL